MLWCRVQSACRTWCQFTLLHKSSQQRVGSQVERIGLSNVSPISDMIYLKFKPQCSNRETWQLLTYFLPFTFALLSAQAFHGAFEDFVTWLRETERKIQRDDPLKLEEGELKLGLKLLKVAMSIDDSSLANQNNNRVAPLLCVLPIMYQLLTTNVFSQSNFCGNSACWWCMLEH